MIETEEQSIVLDHALVIKYLVAKRVLHANFPCSSSNSGFLLCYIHSLQLKLDIIKKPCASPLQRLCDYSVPTLHVLQGKHLWVFIDN